MIVVDSSVWIDFFNGAQTSEVERLDAVLGVTPVAVGDLIVVEVLQGFRSDRDVAAARQLFRSLPLLAMLGPQNAYKAAENFGPCAAEASPCAKRSTGSLPLRALRRTCPCCSVIETSFPMWSISALRQPEPR